ncbi:hypothetical protein N9O24_00480 [bacterium]|nr:hypothetical protein [bacterium]
MFIGAFDGLEEWQQPSHVAVVLLGDENLGRLSRAGIRAFVAPGAADCGKAVAEALEYLEGEVDIIVIALQFTPGPHVLTSSHPDVPLQGERLVKFPFFICKELKL